MSPEDVVPACCDPEPCWYHEKLVREAIAARDKEWIAALCLTSTSMEAAVNSLHNIEVDRCDRIAALTQERDAAREELALRAELRKPE